MVRGEIIYPLAAFFSLALFPLTFLVLRSLSKKEHRVFVAFAVLLLASLGSLYISEVLKVPPCSLCWWQRVFLFSQVPLYLLVLRDKSFPVWQASQVLSFPGFLIAFYHWVLILSQKPGVCAVSTFSSCLNPVFSFWGFLNLPFVSLSVFFFLFLVSFVSARDER